MRRLWLSLIVALSATAFMLYQGGSFAQQQTQESQPAAAGEVRNPEVKDEEAKTNTGAVNIKMDKTSLNNGGTIEVTGTGLPGKPVYVEVWADDKVRASRFDSDPDKETGKRPYILYMTYEMPAFYRILVPKEMQGKFDEIKKEGNKWSTSQALKDLGAESAYSTPAKAKIDRYQATLLGSIMGSRGDLLPTMDEKENRKRSMQLVKARFRSPARVFAPSVEVNPDGAFTARLVIGAGSPPGKYFVRAVVDKDTKSETLTVENSIVFPYLYLQNAGTSVNLFGPFFLTLAIAIFGVLMGAGGGFILNPLLVSLFPFPHTIVAGTVMPTVAFSQATGIINYSKIKFINWKLGTTIGIAMIVGAFIGPKLTELITLAQFKFVFGWILLVLAGLMFWQTTPGYLARNKKEQAILREFKKRAEESARKK